MSELGPILDLKHFLIQLSGPSDRPLRQTVPDSPGWTCPE